jgi:hypothetical protein
VTRPLIDKKAWEFTRGNFYAGQLPRRPTSTPANFHARRLVREYRSPRAGLLSAPGKEVKELAPERLVALPPAPGALIPR